MKSKRVRNSIVTFILVALTMVIAIPLVNASNLFAKDDSSTSFSTALVSQDGLVDDITDYMYSTSEITLQSSYKFNSNGVKKTVTYVFPQGLEVTDIPEIEEGSGVESINKEVDSTTEQTTVTIVYSETASTLSVTSKISFVIDPEDFHSQKEYKITSSFQMGSDTPIEKENCITIHDYYSNSSVETYVTADVSPLHTDEAMEFTYTNRISGEYSNDIKGTGFSVRYTDVKVDMNELLVDIDGNGTYKTVAELGILDSLTVTGGDGYNSTTGILSLANLANNSSNFAKDSFNISFDSAKFSKDSKIKFNGNMYSSKITENLSDVVITPNIIENEFTFEDVKVDTSVSLSLGSTINGVKPNEDKIALYSIIVENGAIDLENVSFEMEVPAGITITQVRPTSAGDLVTDTTFSYQGVTQTIERTYSRFTLDTPIVGPATVTISMDQFSSYADNLSEESSRYYNSGLRFYGEMDDTVSTSVDIELNEVKADYEFEGTSYTNETITNNGTTSLQLNSSYSQTPSALVYDSKYLDDAGNETSTANLGDEITIKSSAKIYLGYIYGSPYFELEDPTFFVSIPAELQSSGSSFTLQDVRFESDNTDYSSFIKNVTVLDAGPSQFSGGTVLRIDIEGFSLTTDIASVYIDTVVDDSLTESKTIINPDYVTVLNTTATSEIDDIKTYNNTDSGYSNIDFNQSDIVNSSQIGSKSKNQLSVVIPQEVGAKTFVDTDKNDGKTDNRYVTNYSDDNDYPSYYIGDEGEYLLQMYNTRTASEDSEFNNYFVFPDLSDYGGSIDFDNKVVSESGSTPTVYYTTDEITDTSQWDEGNYPGITWITGYPDSSIGEDVTAMRFKFDSLSAGTSYIVNIPYTTENVGIEDSVDYDKVIGQSILTFDDSSITDAATAGMMITKSDAPELSNIGITEGNEYLYSYSSLFKSDVLTYTVTDDRTDELVTYDPSNGFADGNSDDLADIEVLYTDKDSNVTTYDKDGFAALTEYGTGTYEITYITEQDADAQVTEETITVAIIPDDAVISATDNSLDYSVAPITDAEIIAALNAKGIDYDGSDSGVTIFDYDGYDASNNGGPNLGKYTITFITTGESGNEVKETAELTITNNVSAKLDGSNKTLEYSEVATEIGSTDADLIAYLEANATDYNNEDITSSVTITNDGGFDFTNYDVQTYTITLSVTGNNLTEITKDVTLTINGDGDKNTIDSQDKTLVLTVDTFPISDIDLVGIMDVAATDGEGDAVSNVTIGSNGGFNVSNPQIGDYTIVFDITYADGTTGTSSSELTVTAPNATLDVYPVTVENVDAPVDLDDVVSIFKNEGGLAYADYDGGSLDSSFGISNDEALVFSSPVVAGEYDFTFSVTGENGNVITKTVALTVKPGSSVINASDASVTYDEAPLTDAEIIATLQASAYDYLGNNIDSLVSIKGYGGYDPDDVKHGVYYIVLTTTDNLSDDVIVELRVGRDNSSYETIRPEVDEIDSATITSEDSTIELSSAPSSISELLDLMNVTALDYDGKDINSDVTIDYGSYDMGNPEIGKYEITFYVTGTDGTMVESTSTLYIAEDSVDIESGGSTDSTESDNGSSILDTGMNTNVFTILGLMILIGTLIIKKVKY